MKRPGLDTKFWRDKTQAEWREKCMKIGYAMGVTATINMAGQILGGSTKWAWKIQLGYNILTIIAFFLMMKTKQKKEKEEKEKQKKR